jgi:hypothetical protein
MERSWHVLLLTMAKYFHSTLPVSSQSQKQSSARVRLQLSPWMNTFRGSNELSGNLDEFV